MKSYPFLFVPHLHEHCSFLRVLGLSNSPTAIPKDCTYPIYSSAGQGRFSQIIVFETSSFTLDYGVALDAFSGNSTTLWLFNHFPLPYGSHVSASSVFSTRLHLWELFSPIDAGVFGITYPLMAWIGCIATVDQDGV